MNIREKIKRINRRNRERYESILKAKAVSQYKNTLVRSYHWDKPTVDKPLWEI